MYTPIAFQGGLTGSLFREFALTLAGAVTISGVVALTLSPMMSAYLLHQDVEEKGLAGWINRTFEKVKAGYGRLLQRTFSARGAIYVSWIVIGGLALLMFQQSPKELAPLEDQGIIFGILNTPANSTIDQITPLTREIHKEMASIPETQFTFQITFPNGGFYGDGLKPWTERKRNVDRSRGRCASVSVGEGRRDPGGADVRRRSSFASRGRELPGGGHPRLHR